MTKKYSVIPHGTVAILSLWLIGCQTINLEDFTQAIMPAELTKAVTPPKVTQAVTPPKVTKAVTPSKQNNANKSFDFKFSLPNKYVGKTFSSTALIVIPHADMIQNLTAGCYGADYEKHIFNVSKIHNRMMARADSLKSSDIFKSVEIKVSRGVLNIPLNNHDYKIFPHAYRSGEWGWYITSDLNSDPIRFSSIQAAPLSGSDPDLYDRIASNLKPSIAGKMKGVDTQEEKYQNLEFIVWSEGHLAKIGHHAKCYPKIDDEKVQCTLSKNLSVLNSSKNSLSTVSKIWCEQFGGSYSVDKVERGFDLFQSEIAQRLKVEINTIIGEKPKASSKIKQGKYESLSQFEARANSLKTKYRQDIQQYTLKVNNFPQWQKNRIIEKSFFNVFGTPKVAKTHYDPESQIFGVEVTASGSGSGNTRFHLMINDVISNADAAAFDSALKDAEPVLRFKLSEGKISLSDAIINIEGRPYAAISVDRNFNKVELAEVDLSTVKEVTTAPETFAIEYSENPTIKSRQIELEQLKIERNTEAKLAQLEAEIVRLKSKTSQAFDDDLLGIVGKLSAIKLDSQKYLFAVGISAYDDVPDVPFADRSAKMVVSVLQKRFGVPAENTYALIDEQATGTKIKGRLAVMLNRVKANDTVYFYYAGHGVPSRDGNQAYLLPRDGGIGSYQDPDFAFSKLLSQLGNSAASRAVVFIDACFSGKANADELVFEGVAPIILSQKEEQFDRNKITIFMAGKGDQFANQYLEKGHRLFSYHLISAIAKRNLNIAMLGEHISKQVSDHSRKLGVTYTQEPFTDGYNKGMLGDRY